MKHRMTLTDEERRLIELLRALNEQGRQSLLTQAEMHFMFCEFREEK